MKTLLILLLLPTIAFGGIFGRRRMSMPMAASVSCFVPAVAVQNIVINNNYPQTQYAYAAPLLGVSPAVIERHSYDLATIASLAYSTNALQALQVSENIIRLQAIVAVPTVRPRLETTLDIRGIRIGPPTIAERSSIISTTCAKCHGPDLASPKGELFLTNDMSDAVRLKALRMVRSGKMPPKNPLNNNEMALFYQELLK